MMVEYPACAGIARDLNLPNNYLNQKLLGELSRKSRFGESRDRAKKQAIEKHRIKCLKEGKPFRIVDARIDGIYSYSTFKNYLRCGSKFNDWLMKEKGVKNANSIRQVAKKYGVEYLKDLETKDYSPYTIRQAKSFLGKMIGKEIDYKLPISKEKEEITKGRSLSKMARGFREDLNRNLVAVARGTGGRRSDIANLRLGNFKKEKGIVTGVDFKGSKGGRSRYSPILPEYQAEITRLVAELERQGYKKEDKVFKTVNSKANIHAYRREYAQKLYNLCLNDENYRSYLMKEYNSREHRLKNGYKKDYKARNGMIYNRESLFISSQALGHGRLDIITTNYFK